MRMSLENKASELNSLLIILSSMEVASEDELTREIPIALKVCQRLADEIYSAFADNII